MGHIDVRTTRFITGPTSWRRCYATGRVTVENPLSCKRVVRSADRCMATTRTAITCRGSDGYLYCWRMTLAGGLNRESLLSAEMAYPVKRSNVYIRSVGHEYLPSWMNATARSSQ